MGVESDFPGTMLGAFIIVSAIFAVVMCSLFRRISKRSIRNCFIGQWVLTCLSFSFLFCITGRRANLPAVLTGNPDLSITLCGISWVISILMMLAGCILITRQRKPRRED